MSILDHNLLEIFHPSMCLRNVSTKYINTTSSLNIRLPRTLGIPQSCLIYITRHLPDIIYSAHIYMTTLHPFSTSPESVLPMWSQAAQGRRSSPDRHHYSGQPRGVRIRYGRGEGRFWTVETLPVLSFRKDH